MEPGAAKAVKSTKNNQVGVIGTPSTVKSEAYNKALARINPNISVYSKPCPLFVPLAEEGWIDDPISEKIAKRYLQCLIDENIDTLILGCTHYPLLKKLIQRVVGGEIKLVDSAEEVSVEIERTLTGSGLLNTSNESGNKQFYLTDVSESFVSIAANFLGEKINNIQQVDIKST